ncbi:retrotransposon protein [Trifolium pratense]|uniref:Retrotransposon protein n=1 Tax=Trifolium pratense TaxID=57577 RepID=A0A2K3PAD6_TRIPR|nr:retrotransposon protein [Trifolium pratense]
MKKDVQAHIRQCSTCQQTKYSTAKPNGLLQPLPIPNHVWEELSMDFITGLPQSRGYSVILVVVDSFSKGVHLGALASGFTAYKVAELFVSMVCKLHGLPRSIVSDRDPIFIKVMNRTIEQYLRAFVHAKPSNWVSLLPWAEYHYNTSIHLGSGFTPFQIMFGKSPPSMPDYVTGSSSIEACDSVLTSREEILELLRENLTKAQVQMKATADKHCKEVTFEVGSWVIGAVAYKLELPPHDKIHDVFHVSLLKPYEGTTPTHVDQLPPFSVDNHPIISPLAILDFQTQLVEGIPTRFSLVQWDVLLPDDTSWEPWNELKQTYDLEDKVAFDDGSIVMDQPLADMGQVEKIEKRPKRIIKLPKRLEDCVLG